jgi:hypothetical protein
VGVGTSIESSVLITANLVDLGVGRIWAKAISLGLHHVRELAGELLHEGVVALHAHDLSALGGQLQGPWRCDRAGACTSTPRRG